MLNTITREEAIKRLEVVAGEIDRIMEALEEGWSEATSKDQTQTFPEKCRGWEVTENPRRLSPTSTLTDLIQQRFNDV